MDENKAMNILILLLGGNPLPNYVVAKYLLKTGREDENIMPVPNKILFMYSKRSEDFFKTFSKNENLGLKNDIYCDINLDDQHRRPHVIQKKLLNKLKELRQQNDTPIKSIHLNYTGGTKPMAVNSFAAVNKFIKDSKIKVIFSDLDPDRFKLLPNNPNDEDENTTAYPLDGDLRNCIQLNVCNLFNLHGMKIVNEGTEKSSFFDNRVNPKHFVSEAVREYISNKKTIFSEFSSRFFIKGKNLDKNEKKLKRKGIFETPFKQIIERFPSLENFFDKENKLIPPAVPFVEFFSGKWLEDYVLINLLKLKAEKEIKVDDIKKGVEASFDDRKTEIDVIVIKGYQLFLVSCTTSREIKYVKHKAFEALYRAEQLGGEHAKVIIVSTMYNKKTNADSFSDENNLEKLENDLNQFDASQNCSLTGINQLSLPVNDEKHLKNELRRIIQGGK